MAMDNSAVSMQKVKEFFYSQIHDEEKWALNKMLLRSVGLFAGSIILMRNFGDLMTV